VDDIETVILLLRHRIVKKAEMLDRYDISKRFEIGQEGQFVIGQNQTLEFGKKFSESRSDSADSIVVQEYGMQATKKGEVVEFFDFIVGEIDRIKLILGHTKIFNHGYFVPP